MKFPECPKNTPEECRFIGGVGSSTCMYSPIEYDRHGKAVGGGRNRQTFTKTCKTCGTQFIQSGTELEFAQGTVQWSQQ